MVMTEGWWVCGIVLTTKNGALTSTKSNKHRDISGIDGLLSACWFGTMFFLTFHTVGNVIIPTDEVIFFQRGRYTTNQLLFSRHLPPGK